MIRWLWLWGNAVWCPEVSPSWLRGLAGATGYCALLFVLPASISSGGWWLFAFLVMTFPWLAAAIGFVADCILEAAYWYDI